LEQLLDFGATFEQLFDFFSNFLATFWEIMSKFLDFLEQLVDSLSIICRSARDLAAVWLLSVAKNQSKPSRSS
jgi:hypothetical protein